MSLILLKFALCCAVAFTPWVVLSWEPQPLPAPQTGSRAWLLEAALGIRVGCLQPSWFSCHLSAGGHPAPCPQHTQEPA